MVERHDNGFTGYPGNPFTCDDVARTISQSAQQVGKTHGMFIRAISVLKVEEGDIIVVESDVGLSQNEYNVMVDTFKGILDHVGIQNVGIVIMDKGVTIKTIRKNPNKKLPRRMDSES